MTQGTTVAVPFVAGAAALSLSRSISALATGFFVASSLNTVSTAAAQCDPTLHRVPALIRRRLPQIGIVSDNFDALIGLVHFGHDIRLVFGFIVFTFDATAMRRTDLKSKLRFVLSASNKVFNRVSRDKPATYSRDAPR